MEDRNPQRRGRVRSPLAPLVRANFVVVVMATAVIAVVSLVAEDLLRRIPADGDLVIWYRSAVLVGMLGLLLIALRYWGTVHRATGTLFHVQVLDEQERDLRAAGRAAAERRRMVLRSVTRWVDLAQRTNEQGAVELADVCRDVSDILEAQVNADQIDTGYTLAPAMAWPVAIAIGAQLPLPGTLRLLELPDGDGDPSSLIELDHAARPVVVECLTFGSWTPNGRIGVWIAAAPDAQELEPKRWAGLGVTSAFRITLDPGLPDDPVLSDEDVAGLGAAIARELVVIKRRHRDRELVVVATMTTIVALATGCYLTQQECRFFHGTHLMHYDRDSDTYLPLRVKEAQPHHAPRAVGA
ncbi:MAG: hypothetical protein ACR2GH_04065 [Pseudonocardia sp.]